MNANRIMSTRRTIQVSNLNDVVCSKARTLRSCAIKAVDIGNRSAAIHFVNRAQKCDSISMRCTLLMGRDYTARRNQS